MEIYAEYFFVENLIADGAIAALTLSLWRKNTASLRFLFAVLLMSLYSFSIFAEDTFLNRLPVKILFSLMVVRILFPEATLKAYIQAAVTFFGVGMLMGGAVSFALLIIKSRGFSEYGVFYVSPKSYPLILLCIGAAYFFIKLFFRIMSERRRKESNIVEIAVSLGDKTCIFEALVDTGNSLREPISDRPVMIGEAEAVRELIVDNYENAKIRIIPYSAVGVKSGNLLGFEVDKVIIRERDREYQGAASVLAVYNGSFGLEEGCRVILHPDMLQKREEKICCLEK